MRSDEITLKSGTKIYANRLIFGISLNEDERPLFNGYDGDIYLWELNDEMNYDPTYTKEELLELADLVIARWNWFKNQVLIGKIDTK